MKVLVTGASGRFAAYMVRALRGKCDIALFSRSEPPADRADLPCIRGDLNDFEACQRAVRGIDVVQHLGAVPWPSDHPGPRAARRARGLPKVPFDATIRTNIVGTYYLLTAAVQAGVRAVIMTGSNCAFGHCFHLTERPYPIVYLPLDEAHPTDHEDSYSYSKFAGEVLLKTFTNAYGIRTYVTRPAGICPPERLQGMAEDAAPAAGWSGGLWGYVPSEDLAEMQLLIQEQIATLPAHSVYVANALDTTALEPTQELIERFRPDLLPVSRSLAGHQALFSTAKAQSELGWTCRHSWRDYLD